MRDGLICKRRAWVAPLNENEIRPHPPVAACDIGPSRAPLGLMIGNGAHMFLWGPLLLVAVVG